MISRLKGKCGLFVVCFFAVVNELINEMKLN